MASSTAIDLDFVPRPSPRVASVTLDGEVAVFDQRTGRVHLLNETGAVVWQLADGSTTVRAIAALVGEVTDAGTDRVRDDILGLVRMLADLGVLAGFEPASEVEPPAP